MDDLQDIRTRLCALQGVTFTIRRFDEAQTCVLAHPPDTPSKPFLAANVTVPDDAQRAAFATFFASALNDLQYCLQEIGRLNEVIQYFQMREMDARVYDE